MRLLFSADVRPFLKALILLHRTYASLPAAARLHVLVRFLTCPFLRIVNAIPHSSRTLLEIGSGHGVFSTLAASREVRTVEVEPDIRKAVDVRRARPRVFVAGFDSCVRGSFDVVAMIDVLYLVPPAEWDDLLRRLHARVAPGGTLLLKEMDPGARIKQRWNRLQETLSVRLLRITLGGEMHFEPVPAVIARLEKAGFTDVRATRIDAFYPHPHILYTARKL